MIEGWRWFGPQDPVSLDDIRQAGATKASIQAWIASMEAVAKAGIRVICYNFMPVVDWCRTDLEWELPNGAKALRFDQVRLAAFDLHILARPGAEADYPEAT